MCQFSILFRLNHFPLLGYTTFLFISWWTFGLFHFLPIRNNAILSICICEWTYVIIHLRCIARSGIAGSCVCSTFWGTTQQFSKVIVPSAASEVPFFPHPCQLILVYFILLQSTSRGWSAVWHFTVIFICICVMTSDVDSFSCAHWAFV